VNANRSAALSPPSSRSRRAAARDEDVAAARSSVGAVTWKRSDRAPIAARMRSTERPKEPIAHGWTSPPSIGTNHAYDRKNVCSSVVRDRPSTPSARRTGDGCGVWYLTARATISVPFWPAGATNAANGASGRTVARPTSIRRSVGFDGIGPVPAIRSTSQCDGTHRVGRRPDRSRTQRRRPSAARRLTSRPSICASR
jgi:hypothetical protein